MHASIDVLVISIHRISGQENTITRELDIFAVVFLEFWWSCGSLAPLEIVNIVCDKYPVVP